MTRPAGAPAVESDPATYLSVHATLDEPACDVLLTDEERLARQDVRSVVAHGVAWRASELDARGAFAHDSYQALVGAGWGGVIFPRRLGGQERSTVTYAVVMEEIAAACPATSLVYMTQMHAAYPILQVGTEQQQRTFIPGLIDGSGYGSLAVTEPDAGSDAAGMRTTASYDAASDGYRLNGSKTFITTGDRADVIVCFATVDRTLRHAGITALVVDGEVAGLRRGSPLRKLGMHASSTSELFFSDAFVPAANRLGEERSGWQLLLNSVVKSRISAAAQGVGIARGAYAHALSYLYDVNGRSLPPRLASELADIRGEIMKGRLLLLATARAVDLAHDATPTAQISATKQHCTRLGFRTAVRLTRLLGAVGDLRELGVERYLRDAKVTEIYDGTNEIQRLLIARDTVDRLKAAGL
jgi:alkylation response protein AidB-like acyl-CoA dehydrogenase